MKRELTLTQTGITHRCEMCPVVDVVSVEVLEQFSMQKVNTEIYRVDLSVVYPVSTV